MAPTPREMQGGNQAGRAEEHTVQGRAHGTHEGWHKHGEVCRGDNENRLCKRDADEGGMCKTTPRRRANTRVKFGWELGWELPSDELASIIFNSHDRTFVSHSGYL